MFSLRNLQVKNSLQIIKNQSRFNSYAEKYLDKTRMQQPNRVQQRMLSSDPHSIQARHQELRKQRTTYSNIEFYEKPSKVDFECYPVKKARLMFQTGLRGSLEQGILCNFIHRYLDGMSTSQVNEFDRLINSPIDLYNVIHGRVKCPEEFDCEVMDMLKDHCDNKEMKEVNRLSLSLPSLGYGKGSTSNICCSHPH